MDGVEVITVDPAGATILRVIEMTRTRSARVGLVAPAPVAQLDRAGDF